MDNHHSTTTPPPLHHASHIATTTPHYSLAGIATTPPSYSLANIIPPPSFSTRQPSPRLPLLPPAATPRREERRNRPPSFWFKGKWPTCVCRCPDPEKYTPPFRPSNGRAWLRPPGLWIRIFAYARYKGDEQGRFALSELWAVSVESDWACAPFKLLSLTGRLLTGSLSLTGRTVDPRRAPVAHQSRVGSSSGDRRRRPCASARPSCRDSAQTSGPAGTTPKGKSHFFSLGFMCDCLWGGA